MGEHSKKILLTGARSYITLDLARQLNTSGHVVYVADTSKSHVCEFSKAIRKSFVIPSPRFETKKFVSEIVNIIEKHQIDMFIPIWEETFYISQALDQFPSYCKVFCMPFDKLEPLHNKWKLSNLIKDFAPKTILLNSQEDLNHIPFKTPYALKACYCRASQQMYKITPPNPLPQITITPNNPWIAQQWIEGKRYCSYSICNEGKVNAISLYPVEFAINGTSCITFKHVDHPKIFAWIEKFVKDTNFTGQVGFDFIEAENLYVIDCNPRATCGLHLFEYQDDIEKAFLNTHKDIIYPRKDVKKQIAIGMLMYGWQKQHFPHFLRTLLNTQDVIFSTSDPKPFFMMPYLFTNYWRTSRQLKQPMHSCFYYDIEWNNE